MARLRERLGGAADGRWAVALLDPYADDRALYHLARLRPQSACDAVFAAIPRSLNTMIRPALLALTALGGACRPHFEQLAAHPTAPREVRNAARDMLDMLP